MAANELDPAREHWFEHFAMACDWGIGIRSVSEKSAGAAAQAAFDEIDRLESELSRFRSDSDITRLNCLQPGEWLTVGFVVIDERRFVG